MLSALEEKELNYLIETTDFPTGTVHVKLDERGIPSYTITENVAWDHIPFTARTENLAKSTAAACYGLLAQEARIEGYDTPLPGHPCRKIACVYLISTFAGTITARNS